jgi:hypothetical protein
MSKISASVIDDKSFKSVLDERKVYFFGNGAAKCKEMTEWLKKIRCFKKPKEWWETLRAKLRGHYQYYGVSGNSNSINAYYKHTMRMLHKWLNRRSQKQSMTWANFQRYMKCYPVPKPKIVHNFYTWQKMFCELY